MIKCAFCEGGGIVQVRETFAKVVKSWVSFRGLNGLTIKSLPPAIVGLAAQITQIRFCTAGLMGALVVYLVQLSAFPSLDS